MNDNKPDTEKPFLTEEDAKTAASTFYNGFGGSFLDKKLMESAYELGFKAALARLDDNWHASPKPKKAKNPFELRYKIKKAQFEKANARIAELEAWKRQAIEVQKRWDDVYNYCQGNPDFKLGENISTSVLEKLKEIKKLREERDEFAIKFIKWWRKGKGEYDKKYVYGEIDMKELLEQFKQSQPEKCNCQFPKYNGMVCTKCGLTY